ncbi:Tetratricopeptide repeat-containing protein [Saccharopolyspora antimicrobica]|uniref:Tetratricopeptide repeat protein n=1 Tax=Saccharopolyspora antimicrobica TaxID=455193 RepID=A0A1I5CH62_9PSEU|nr:tetratricopeptide repeat protein [Saccharopolyspora antimicrobica]RKT88855.1 tetratricopeptide repeat protein [Saccharopolyspora antimicrobica]SFN86350.1 Tetratricopeptide repeat-containing protein [Saccharopolyspora antimicrobica]
MSGLDLQGPLPTGERWKSVRDNNNEGAQLLRAGQIARSAELFEQAIALTRVADVDAEGLDLRCRALSNLAAARELSGDLGGAIAGIEEAIGTGQRVLAEIGDRRGTRSAVLSGHLSRAQTLILLGRLDEALESADRAAALLSGTDSELLRFTLHNVRCGIFLEAGRLPEAEQEGELALEVALASHPELSASVYPNLAGIAQLTGDDATAQDYLALAEQINRLAGDATSRQHAVENLARTSLQTGRLEEARRGFGTAEALAVEAGLPTRAAASRCGVAAVHLRSGRPEEAAEALREAIRRFPAGGAHLERLQAWGLLGDAESARMDFAAAEDAYIKAREHALTTQDRCRIDVRRAEMHAEWAAASPDDRAALLGWALDLAVVAHLATEALRETFPPGATRERWVGSVAAPARELAFRLAAVLRDTRLLLALTENASAAVTFHSPTTAAVSPWEAEIEPPAPTGSEIELPAAAAGLLTGSTQTPVRFQPPPRVLSCPGAEVLLAEWFDRAEQRYGIRVRSEEAVAGW